MTNKERIAALRKQHMEIEHALKESRIVDDVLERRILTATREAKHEGLTTKRYTPDEVYNNLKERFYLPKGRLEPDGEYMQRIAMTPFFPELPGIMNDRQGALFSDTPRLEGTDAKAQPYVEFAANCDGAGATLVSAMAKTARLIQRHGMCAVLLDRMPLDEETEARAAAGQLSEAEATARRLQAPRALIYEARDVLDFEYDAAGLAWVKLVERTQARATWDQPAARIETYRIIDRKNVTTYTVTMREGQDEELSGPATKPHEFDFCPVVIGVSPIHICNGMGLSMLIDVAQADVAATRLLSDIMWDLFVLGQPLLTFTTHRDEDELKKMQTGASRYIPLKAGTGQREEEKLAYVVLDSTGIDLQMEVYAAMQARAREVAGRASDTAVAAPSEESGVARAWRFKTGEERTLFLLTNQLQNLWDGVLDMVAQMIGRGRENISVKFSTKFDMNADQKSVDIIDRVLSTARGNNLPAMAKAALKRMPMALGKLSEEEENDIAAEIESADIKPPMEPEGPTDEPGPDEDEDEDEPDDGGDA